MLIYADTSAVTLAIEQIPMCHKQWIDTTAILFTLMHVSIAVFKSFSSSWHTCKRSAVLCSVAKVCTSGSHCEGVVIIVNASALIGSQIGRVVLVGRQLPGG